MHQRESRDSARRNGLRYASYAKTGISRARRGTTWRYTSASGKVIQSPAVLRRLDSLAVPPAWTRVWICPDQSGHIQATGFDARGRRQYLYHQKWTATRNLAKFETLPQFAAALPTLRARVDRDLRQKDLTRQKVAACIVHLMDRTLIRVGNAEYARDNDSYGLTTVLNRHAHVSGSTIHFKFKAKSGRDCDVSTLSPRAARIVRKCQDLPGQELFCYRNGTGAVHDIGSAEVNAYLSECVGGAFTAKDFRTWGGTCAAASALCRLEPPAPDATEASIKRSLSLAVKAAAQALGNTPTVCRKFYIHPLLTDAFTIGRLHHLYTRADRAHVPRLSRCERTLALLLKSAGPARRRGRESS